MNRFCSPPDESQNCEVAERSWHGTEIRHQETPSTARTTWHGLTGRFSATVISLLVDRAIIRSWLHSGLALPDGDESQQHQVFLYLGRQESVSPMVFGRTIRFPFCYSYPEIITAVPDLVFRSADGKYHAGPVTYLPRLFLGAWAPTLLGRGLYGICKSYATFEIGPASFRATNRRGRQLLDAQILCSDRSVSIGQSGGLQSDFAGFLPQPVAVGKGRQLGLARLAFNLTAAEIRPARVSLHAAPGLVSWMPEIQAVFPDCDEIKNGAFHFTAGWTLARHK